MTTTPNCAPYDDATWVRIDDTCSWWAPATHRLVRWHRVTSVFYPCGYAAPTIATTVCRETVSAWVIVDGDVVSQVASAHGSGLCTTCAQPVDTTTGDAA